jgi:formylglycine-generating enzyme required for sulfatase activity
MVENLRTDPIDIPGYRFERWLGRGGMADVYLATQLSLGRSVAIKVLATERTPSDQVIARFEQEARIIARLDHPHIVGIFDVGRTPAGLLYYTMPYMPHGDLAARDFMRDQAGVVDVVRALCQALAYAHEQGVVHRDVKPENVLYDQLGNPRLADFGIAFTNPMNTRVTKEGSTLGSVAYMSPEQARGRPVDRRSDIYSLGVVCYECLTGKLPFSGQDSMSMALAHVEQPVPRLPSARRHWQWLIDRAMAKKPEDRFQTAQEMLDALDSLNRRMAIVAPVTALASSLADVPGQLKRGMKTTVRARAIGAIAVFAFSLCVIAAYAVHYLGGPRILQDAPTTVQQQTPHEPESAKAAPEVAVPARDAANSSEANTNGADAVVANTPAPADEVTSDASTQSAPVGSTETSPTAPTSVASAPVVIHDAGGPEMVVVPAQVQHHGKTYDLAQAFALARYEVTRGEYAEFARASGRAATGCRQPGRVWSVLERLNWRSPGFAQEDRHPVVCVSWEDATAYAQWLSKTTHHRYRLPSQAEWLHAARLQGDSGNICKRGNVYDASTRTLLHLASRYDCSDGFPQTAPVGRFEPNALGIYDIIGNASEWTRDCVPRKSANGKPCTERIFRGISWHDGPDRHNLEYTGTAAPDVAFTTVGIRLARDLDAKTDVSAGSGAE